MSGTDRPRALPEMEIRSNLLLDYCVVDEQRHPFARREIVDEQPELVASRERPDVWRGCISISPFADEFDRPSIVSTEFELTHVVGYHGSEYGCIRFERRSVLPRSLRTDTDRNGGEAA